VYYQGADHGILSNDFTSTNIDATSLNTQSISITSLFALIKNANANLDTNAIKLQYDSDDTATEN
jgi:hypothetical protein